MTRTRLAAAAKRSLACALALTLAGAGGLAQTRPGPVPVQAGDPAFDAARVAFEGLPEAERREIQDALVWTGDYNGTVRGVFGRRTYDGILAFQKRAKAPATGVLDAAGRKSLAAAARKARAAVDFKPMDDPATGLRIGLPHRILTKRERNASGGSRWQSADGRITLDTRAVPAGEADLPRLFERSSATTPGRQVTYKLSRPDFFVVSGETPNGKFYIRFAAGGPGLRGFSLAYDKGLAKTFDAVVIAIANSFDPFPGPADRAADPVAVTPSQPAPPALVGTGIVVGPDTILTAAAAIAACGDVRVGGAQARVRSVEAGGGLALVAGVVATSGVPPLRPGAMEAAEPVVVLAAAAASGPDAVVAIPGSVEGDRVSAPIQPGGAGAPVFDRTGALVGLLGASPDSSRKVAGVVPPLSHPLVPAATIRANLPDLAEAAAGPGPLSAGEIASRFRGAVLPITCVGAPSGTSPEPPR